VVVVWTLLPPPKDVKEEFLKVFPQSFRFKPPLLTMLKCKPRLGRVFFL